MWQRLTHNRFALATAIFSLAAILVSVAGWAIVYASLDSSGGRRFMGWLAMSAWSGTPYAGTFAGACLFASRRRSSMLLMVGSAVIALLAAWVVMQTALSSHDGQAALALVALPLLQWGVLAAVVVLALVFRTKSVASDGSGGSAAA
jgi:hypothetical protein